MKTIILIQGIYYFVTGVWPLIHVRSFEAITGKKKDHWLLYCVSLMITSSSVVFISASLLDSINLPVIVLAISNIISLSFIDIYFSLKDVIRKVYLLDALLEVTLLISIFLSYERPS